MELLIMGLLGLTSIVSVTFIVERGLALRWGRVIPPAVETAVENCRTAEDLPRLREVCLREASPLSRLLMVGAEHRDWPKDENENIVQTKARHEITQLERGLVVLEIATGIAPLMGLVGTVYGMILLFADIGQTGLEQNTASAQFAGGIALALRATLSGLLIAIPSLVAWSYYTRKVETLAVEMENLCEEFLRRLYRNAPRP
jgi:biopolymer transport protein ExbB